ncbi:ATP-binding cassette domain-containing protein [Persicimonas caeni]|nr:ATP-binding cassette domain-containing protein [Persicimonas caeni]
MISCFHLTVAHPHHKRPLLDDISLEVEKGDFAEIVGPAGAGKSLLFSILSLRSKVAHGKCIIAGRNLDRLDPNAIAELRQTLGSCAQQPTFLDERTALENLILPLVARGRAEGALETVEAQIEGTRLEQLERVPAGGLSDAERRLLGIYRALVGRPRLVLVDGGLEGLGELEADAIAGLRAASERGATIVLTGRQLSALDGLRTRTLRLNDGRLEADGAPSENPAAIHGAA